MHHVIKREETHVHTRMYVTSREKIKSKIDSNFNLSRSNLNLKRGKKMEK